MASKTKQIIRPLLVYLQNMEVSSKEGTVEKMMKQKQKSNKEGKELLGSSWFLTLFITRKVKLLKGQS